MIKPELINAFYDNYKNLIILDNLKDIKGIPDNDVNVVNAMIKANNIIDAKILNDMTHYYDDITKIRHFYLNDILHNPEVIKNEEFINIANLYLSTDKYINIIQEKNPEDRTLEDEYKLKSLADDIYKQCEFSLNNTIENGNCMNPINIISTRVISDIEPNLNKYYNILGITKDKYNELMKKILNTNDINTHLFTECGFLIQFNKFSNYSKTLCETSIDNYLKTSERAKSIRKWYKVKQKSIPSIEKYCTIQRNKTSEIINEEQERKLTTEERIQRSDDRIKNAIYEYILPSEDDAYKNQCCEYADVIPASYVVYAIHYICTNYYLNIKNNEVSEKDLIKVVKAYLLNTWIINTLANLKEYKPFNRSLSSNFGIIKE